MSLYPGGTSVSVENPDKSTCFDMVTDVPVQTVLSTLLIGGISFL